MEVIRIPRIMREISKELRFKGKSIGFIPTMGALHEGHLSLIRRAKEENDIVIVSIFVNPTQFAQGEDYEKYPRDVELDKEKLEALAIDYLFLPDVNSLYPEGYSTYVVVEGLSDKLCGIFRPGHFRGVATIVCKLFNIVKPLRAYFGQKDYQQSLIIRRMVEDLNFDVEIIVCPTVREQDGLAMSSRNLYLNEKERQSATVIYKALKEGERLLNEGEKPLDVKLKMHEIFKNEPLIREIQYAGVYDPLTLEEVKERQNKYLLAVALKIGDTRLIDNLIVE
ncbi:MULTISPECIES: pantoate--beta-alanine ligase [Thermodesulfovibrio]|uniref:Pantothenate synthetase n=1 Tax=Thermodesulfovibrio yellowstonii (strain ATCC 51303 / DSM 11347 / YP87) TaxID=289376 RepID=PANC_THEYD|nr:MULTISPECIES: pantoate--beta-alanine ligase [Thermodesulfovibrio]B5YJ91.1 RecName: Full=Pantothenate synthetase; Short=PS; AltName: Full=Pantoate--beta-alanine ligase; AltName: Full=Pantoate-activating enzyme [Thermodesulfovibrio yellowstonii DSM 11347]ACI22055.1 pantoate--beta-alanine ligase [Thermodesulfovibrio yellowstonii DSM 11347]